MKKTAIIGAGMSGLSSLHQMVKEPNIFDPVVFERSTKPGGLWVYTNQTGSHVNNRIYRNLRTNVPKEIMGLPDFPFPSHLPSYLHHSDIRTYIDEFADHFDLLKYIKFQTIATRVHPLTNDPAPVQWEVTTRDLKTNIETTGHYDAVLICNGSHHVPNIPQIPGSELFQGQFLHSKDYRDPEMFRGKTVVIMGMSVSGRDISFEVAPFAVKLYTAHHNPNSPVLPDTAIEMPDIQEIKPAGVIFTNGEYHEADVILYCTGYAFSYPFLSEKCQVKIEDARITPLYKHIHHIEFPSLFFINILTDAYRFRMADFQAGYIHKYLCGEVELPSKETMLLYEKQDFNKRVTETNNPQKFAHLLIDQDLYDYLDDLAKIASIKAPEVVLRKIIDNLTNLLLRTPIPVAAMRNINYCILDDKNVQIKWHYP